jgi:hypothetical protein
MKFYVDKHLYLAEDGEQYTSVTTLVKKFQKKKDWDKIAAAYAKKNKLDVNDVKAQWADESTKGTTKGSLIHGQKEKELLDAKQVRIGGVTYDVKETPIVNGVKAARSLKLTQGIYPELIVYSNKFKIAGQADLISIVENKIIIDDYKTNKKIDKESYKHWKDGHDMMQFPLNKYMDCNFNHYMIQLNIYMFLVKAHNPMLDVGPMTIKHILENGDIVDYEVPEIQRETRRLLNYYSERNTFSFI